MSLTKIGSIGINTGIQLAGVTTVSTLKVGSGITMSSDGEIFATGISTFSDDVNLSADLNITGDNNKLRITSAIGNLGIISSTTHDVTFDFFDNDTQTRLRTVDGRFQISADHRNEVADSQIRFIVDGTNQASIDGNGHLYFRNDSDTYFHRPDTNTLAFVTGGSERARIESAGNVGIGTTNANNKLHVYGGKIKAQTSTDDTDTDVDLIRAQCGSGGGSLFSIRAKDAADDNSNWDIKTNANEDLSFTIGGSTERVRINTDGRLLIGSSSVINVGGSSNSGYLQIEGTSANSSSIALINNQNSTQSPVIRFGKTRGTSTGSVTTVADGDLLGRIAFAGADGTDLQNSTAAIDVKVNGTVAGDQIPTDIIFDTSATTGNARAERLRIASGGNIGINQSTPTAKLQVTGGGAYTVANSGRSVEGIDINSTSGDVDGAFGGAISFGVGQAGRSAIAAVQNSSDEDNTGLAFFTHPSNTGSADAVERVRIDSTGVIGIGTVAPENDIQLVNDAATVKLTSTGSGNSTRLILESEADTYGGIHFGDPSDEDAGRIRYYHGGSAPNHMAFSTNATEKLRIFSSGQVGINTDGEFGAPNNVKLLVDGDMAMRNSSKGDNSVIQMGVYGKAVTMTTSALDLLQFNAFGNGAVEITVFRRDTVNPQGAQVSKLYIAFGGSGNNITSASLVQEDKVTRGSIHNFTYSISENNTYATLTATGDNNGGESQSLDFYVISSGGNSRTITVL